MVTMCVVPLVVPQAWILKSLVSLFTGISLGKKDNRVILIHSDEKTPHAGVIVKMSSTGPKLNCSLSVSVICDSNGVQGPHSLEKLGTCDYATMLRHPSGCAKKEEFHGRGWGLFGTFITIVLSLFGGYLLAGTIYRYFILGVHGVDVIPNLDIWTSLPQRTQSMFTSLVQRVRGPSEGHRSSYSRVDF